MSIYTAIDAVTLTAGEQALLAAVGMTGEDGLGMMNSAKMELDAVNVKLARITANIGAGANKTAIDAFIAGALT